MTIDRELGEKREELLFDLERADGRLDDAVERMMSRSVGKSLDDLLAAREQASTALKAFDSEHPEFLAEIDRKQAELAKRHLWD